VTADMIIVVAFFTSDSSLLASSYPCVLDSDTKRPVVGIIKINSNKVKTKTLISDVSTIEHEIIHLLGFSKDVFQFFPQQNEQPVYFKNEQNQMIFRGKNFIEVVQEHFNCPDITEGSTN
jgi:hypothetical protein